MARDAERVALEVLKAESAQFGQSFRWNEEIGERRVTMVLTLMTVAAAASGIIADSVDIRPEAKLRLVAWVALALFVLGLVTLARLVRRNVASDEYRWALDTIRLRLIALGGEDLDGYWPFPGGPPARPGEPGATTSPKPKPRRLELKRLLGLTLLMSTTNSVLLTAATVLGFAPPRGWAILLGGLVFVLSLVGQVGLARALERRLKMEVELLPEKR